MLLPSLAHISTHAPRAGSDPTSPGPGWTSHFNPRSPCGERLVHAAAAASLVLISTHAPRAGSDPNAREMIEVIRFQPTLPVRGATTRPWP